MGDAEEDLQIYDCFLINLEIDDCPMAEIPLGNLFDVKTLTLLDDYQAILRETIVEVLEDTTWLDTTSMAKLLDAGYGTYHVREGGLVISLRRAALQRLVTQKINDRAFTDVPLQIPISIRFLLSAVDLPKAPKTPSTTMSVGLEIPTIQPPPAPPSAEHTSASESEFLDQLSELPGISPILPQAAAPTPEFTVPGTGATPRVNFPDSFRGIPVNAQPTGIGVPGTARASRREYSTPYDPHDDSGIRGEAPPQPRRGSLFDSDPNVTRRSSVPLVRTPTRLNPFSAEVTFGAETFEDYMSQFMFSEVRFKDFRKAVIPKFDSSRNEIICTLVQIILLDLSSMGNLVPTL